MKVRQRILWLGTGILLLGLSLVFVPDKASSPAPNGFTTNSNPIPGEEPAQSSPTSKARTTTPSTSKTSTYPKAKIENGEVIQDSKRYPLRTYKPALTPNDPQADQPWVTNANMSGAWDIAPGSKQVLLAVIDTGFALKHEEFAGRWHQNIGETGTATTEGDSALNCQDRGLTLDASCNLIDDDYDGVVDNETGSVSSQNPSRLNCSDQDKPLQKDCNRIDDDGNGLVDDYSGWDFTSFDNLPQAGEVNPNGAGIHHGSYVLGIAAATGNNAKGFAGVDWTAKLLPIQALDDDAYGNTLSVSRAIRYAADQGADVISLSLGSTLSDPLVREAVRDATAKGSVVVAAAGNDGCNCMIYPANYPEVVAVGALTADNQPADFSSWGDNLDILAPGVNLYTTDWSSGNQTNAYASNISGTSLATPVVSGLLARLASHHAHATPLQLIAALTETTDKTGLSSNQSRSATLGFGKLNGQSASARIITPISPNQIYAFTPVSNGSQFNPSFPAETGSFSLYECPVNKSTTPIFELTKDNKKLFTASPTESYLAVSQGYTSNRFAYTCAQLPHDTPQTVRNLNIFSEFRNISLSHKYE